MINTFVFFCPTDILNPETVHLLHHNKEKEQMLISEKVEPEND